MLPIHMHNPDLTHNTTSEPAQADLPALLQAIYSELEAYYGPQQWWPGHTNSPWEIMLGSVLTQNTSWTNVENALRNVLSYWGPEGLIRPELALEAPLETLTALLRPAGFYNVKPLKVRNLAQFVLDEGGIEALASSPMSTEQMRDKFLAVWGVGPETADAILLYAFGRPTFVADAYALRLTSRWGLLQPKSGYDQIQGLFMDNLPHDTQLFNEYHALIIAHGKALCKPRPRCEACPLNKDILYGRNPETGESKQWCCPKLHTQHAQTAKNTEYIENIKETEQ